MAALTPHAQSGRQQALTGRIPAPATQEEHDIAGASIAIISRRKDLEIGRALERLKRASCDREPVFRDFCECEFNTARQHLLEAVHGPGCRALSLG